MLKYNYLLILSLLLVLVSCTKNKEDFYIKDLKSNEKAIIDVKINNQIGTPILTRTADVSTAIFKVFGKPEDLKSLKPNFALSFGANITPASGSAIDFTVNPDNSQEYTVTSQSGETRKWKVSVQLFVNPYEGSWKIDQFRFTWDDGNGWGNDGKDEVKSKLPSAAAGSDDLIIFGPLSANSEGQIFGTYERTNGTDGLAPSFISSKSKDWTNKFGQLPNGKGKYFINSDNTISIILDGQSKSIQSIGVTVNNGSTIEYDLFTTPFNKDAIDWSDYYGISDNKFCVAKRIWYILKKN